ncbi:TrkA C-terminal domain-containing protein [Faecalibaculum rodentium]|nr:TrkA C-terminal domain-containing protein [Faecalibaculum rodentium]
MTEGIHGILRSQCLHGADVAGGKRIARFLNMTDLSGNVLKTFSDYSEDPDLQFSLVELMPGSSWHGKSLAELRLPSGMATALILRRKEKLIPHGETILQAQSTLVFVDSGSLR